MAIASIKDLVKQVHNIPMDTVVDACGLGPVPAGRKITSIYQPEERTPSMHVYDTSYWCYATGQGGDQIQFVRDAMNVQFRAAVLFLARGARSHQATRPTPKRQWKDLTDVFFGEPEGSRDDFRLFGEHVAAKWPTLTPELILGWGSRVTCNSELWTPHYHPTKPDVVVGVKIRRLYPSARSKLAVPGSTFTMGLYHVEEPTGRPLRMWLVEGESDVWAMQHAVAGLPNVAVVGLPSGAGTFHEEWFDRWPIEHLYVALDGDEAGRAATEAVRDRFCVPGGRGVHLAFTVDVPGGRVAEALADGWDVRGVVPGVRFLDCEDTTDE